MGVKILNDTSLCNKNRKGPSRQQHCYCNGQSYSELTEHRNKFSCQHEEQVTNPQFVHILNLGKGNQMKTLSNIIST